MRFYIAALLLVAGVVSCSKAPSNKTQKATLLISMDLSGDTNVVPVAILDDFFAKRSFSKAGGLFDNRHIVRGMTYETPNQMLMIVSVAEGPKIKLLNINGVLYDNSLNGFEKVFHDLQTELARKFPGRMMKTQFEPSGPNNRGAGNGAIALVCQAGCPPRAVPDHMR